MLGDAEIPELVLEHDRHFLRVLVAQALGQAHAGMLGREGNIEVMVAWKSVLGGLGQELAHDSLERVLHHEIVAEEVLGHRRALAE